MSAIFSQPKLPPVQPVPPAPAPEDPDVEGARQQALVEAANQRGRRASIVTGGEGVTEEAPTRRARVFGA